MNFSSSNFDFWMPVESFHKSASSESKDGRRMIRGVASTGGLDLQGEKVVQSGIDYGYFLTHGYINNDHLSGPENIVGEPTSCKLTKDGLFITAFLYKNHAAADKWWSLLNSLDASGASRKVGFSIQGKVLLRQGKTILKCFVSHCAITAQPVNTQTWAEIVKSLSEADWDHSDLTEEEEKSLSTATGGMLVPESMDSKERYLSKSQTIEAFMERGYSRTTANILANSIFLRAGSI